MFSRGLYIDPNNYADPLELLRNFASEIDRDDIKIDSCIGGGERQCTAHYRGHSYNPSKYLAHYLIKGSAIHLLYLRKPGSSSRRYAY